MVNVTQIGEMGAYVTLLEYDNIEVSLYFFVSLLLTVIVCVFLLAFFILDFSFSNECLFLLSSQGMILLSELSRRRIRSINKLVRVNRTEIVMVIRVDKEKSKYNDHVHSILEYNK